MLCLSLIACNDSFSILILICIVALPHRISISRKRRNWGSNSSRSMYSKCFDGHQAWSKSFAKDWSQTHRRRVRFWEKADLKEKVDALEKDYHEAGCEVVQATRKLNEALDLSEKLHSLSTSLNDWLTSKLLQTCSDLEVVPMIKESVQEMVKKRESYEEIRRYYDY